MYMNQLRYRPCIGPSAPTALVAVVIGLTIVGCGQKSDESRSTAQTTAVARPGVPKLVDLGATECIPCKKMAPILEELEVQYAGVLAVEFIDVGKPENKETAKSYGIEEIPTQIFLDPEGNELWRHVGFIPKTEILAKWSELGYELKPAEEMAQASAGDLSARVGSAESETQGKTAVLPTGPSRITVYYLFNTFRCATCRRSSH